MAIIDYVRSNKELVQELLAQHPRKRAMSIAIGGEWEAFGVLGREILVAAGLRKDHYLIDVGCGSGRLAHTLDVERYLGIDVVPELIAYCREVCRRPTWHFEVVDQIAIPEEAGTADMVCFFSVFTHLLHQDSYRYLLEANRVLKPGGKVVFSFHDFLVRGSWNIFEIMVRNNAAGVATVHDQFVGRDAIYAWAEHSGFLVEVIYPGDVPHIHVPCELTTDNGDKISGMECLGQSVCILQKPRMLGPFLIGRLVGDHLCFDLLTLQTNGALQVLGWQRTGSTKPLTLLSLRVNGIERPLGVQRHERPDVPDVHPSGFCLDANVGAETIRTIELLWEGACIFSKSDV